MFLPVGRTETEVSSLRHLFQPNLRMTQALQRWIAGFKAQADRGATLYSPKLVSDQADRWLEDYSRKLMEIVVDTTQADLKHMDLLARPYHQYRGPESSAPILPTLRELEKMDAQFKAAATATPVRPSPAIILPADADEEASEEADEDDDEEAQEEDPEAAEEDFKDVPKHGAASAPTVPAELSSLFSIPKITKVKRTTDSISLDPALQDTSTTFSAPFSSLRPLPSLDSRIVSYRHGLFYTSYVWCLWELCDASTIININHHLLDLYVSQGYDTSELLAPILYDIYRSMKKTLIEQSRGKSESRIVYLLRWFSAVARTTNTSILEYLRGESLAWLRVEKHIGWGSSIAFRWDFIRHNLTSEEHRYWREHEIVSRETWIEKAAGYPQSIKTVLDTFRGAELEQFIRFVVPRSSSSSSLLPMLASINAATASYRSGASLDRSSVIPLPPSTLSTTSTSSTLYDYNYHITHKKHLPHKQTRARSIAPPRSPRPPPLNTRTPSSIPRIPVGPEKPAGVCKLYSRDPASCRFGDQCRFAHPPTSLRDTSSTPIASRTRSKTRFPADNYTPGATCGLCGKSNHTSLQCKTINKQNRSHVTQVTALSLHSTEQAPILTGAPHPAALHPTMPSTEP